MHPVITRRQFLERASSATALLLTVRAAEAADGMFVSLNGSLTPGVSGADKARLAAKLGYGGVDWDFGPARKAGVEETSALFKELEDRADDRQPAFSAALRRRRRRVQRQAAAARRGCGLLQRHRLQQDDAGPLAGGAAPKDEQRRLVVDRLAAISRSCRNRISASGSSSSVLSICGPAPAGMASRVIHSSGRSRKRLRSPRTPVPTLA